MRCWSAKPSPALHTLAAHQAPNGQIPKFVDAGDREADFWYLGCIDSTLWWLIAIAFLDARSMSARPASASTRSEIRLALQWLLAQEHQRFFLLQQNEASDWADIMPRSGFVLYTNALWYHVKRLYRVPHARETRASFNGLFHPFSAGIAEYRRARLLNEYVLRKARNRDLVPELRQLLVLRRRGRHVRQRARGALWTGGRASRAERFCAH